MGKASGGIEHIQAAKRREKGGGVPAMRKAVSLALSILLVVTSLGVPSFASAEPNGSAAPTSTGEASAIVPLANAAGPLVADASGAQSGNGLAALPQTAGDSNGSGEATAGSTDEAAGSSAEGSSDGESGNSSDDGDAGGASGSEGAEGPEGAGDGLGEGADAGDVEADGLDDEAALAAAAAADGISLLSDNKLIYWNPSDVPIRDPDDQRIIAAAGDDTNTGASADYPVLTYDRVQELFRLTTGATVVVMTTVQLGSTATNGAVIAPQNMTIDGIDPQSTLNNDVTFTFWDKTVEELFLVPDEGDGSSAATLTLKDVKIVGDPVVGTMRIIGGIDNTGGQLNIGKNVTVEGAIQTDLDDWGRSDTGSGAIYNPIKLTATPSAGTVYTLYYSGIADNLNYQYVNVVETTVPGLDIKPYFQLNSGNTAYNWQLVYDNEGPTLAGDPAGVFDITKLELYCSFQYEAIYLSGKGDDENFGGNCRFPVKTFDRAKELLEHTNLQGTGVIYICDTVTISGTETWSLPVATFPDARVMICKDPDHKHNESAQAATLTANMIRVPAGATLTTSDITIQMDASPSSDSRTVLVQPGGTFNMNDGTRILGSETISTAVVGIGVDVQGAAGKKTTFTMTGGEIGYRSQGVRIKGVSYQPANTVFDMSGGTIQNNYQYSRGAPISGDYGAGISAGDATVSISDTASIAGNQAYNTVGSTSSISSHGGGLYAKGNTTITMTGGTFDANRAPARSGGGGAVSLHENAKFIMTGGTMKNNQVGEYGIGGAIAAYKYSSVDISGGALFESNYGRNGGAVYANDDASLRIAGATFKSNTGTYAGAVGTGSTVTLDLTAATFDSNKAEYGGAIHGSNIKAIASSPGSIVLTANTATRQGGNLSTFESRYGNVVLEGVVMEKGTAPNGAGVYTSGGILGLTDCTITDNVSAGSGGGLYAAGGTITLDGSTTVARNEAVSRGGGIAIQSGSFIMKAGDVTDNVCTDGVSDNAYFADEAYLLGGRFGAASPTAGGIFVDIPTNHANKVYVDANQLTLDNNNFFLNTALSRLFLLDAPGASVSMPISVNTDVFEVGSTVVEPAGSVTVAGQTYDLEDASPHVATFEGGTIPAKTTLGGFNKNIILVGQGVYIDGSGGNDVVNGGTSPDDAVATYARAEQILRERIADANTASLPENQTFEPFIYICGEVRVIDNQVWSLDYLNDSAYTQQHKAYDAEWFPQVKRFASYYGTMVTALGGSGDLTFENIVVNGMAEAVSPEDPNVTSSIAGGVDAIIDIDLGASVTLDSGSVVTNNFQYGIRMKGQSSITLQGDSLVSNHRNDALTLSAGSTAHLLDQARITCETTSNLGYTGRAGVSVSGSNGPLMKTSVFMQDESVIEAKGSLGIEVQDGAKAVVGTSSDTDAFHPTIIVDGGTGIYAANDAEVTLQGFARLESATAKRGIGYHAAGGSDAIAGPKLTAKDDVMISGFSSALRFGSSRGASADLSGRTKIDLSQFGIYAGGSGSLAYADLAITFTDDAGIDSCDRGVYMDLRDASIGPAANVTFSGNSYIDNSLAYSAYEDYASGTNLTLADNARFSTGKMQGVYVRRAYDIPYYTAGTVTLSDQAKISGFEKNGILINDYSVERLSDYDIVMTGSATVSDNGQNGVKIDQGPTLTMGPGTSIVRNNSDGTVTRGMSIWSKGALFIDVNAEIDDETYLAYEGNIITLTNELGTPVDQLPAGKFKLAYVQAFVGHRAVGPDAARGVADATEYYDLYQTTDNIPEDYGIVHGTDADETYIVVIPGRDVYIAGTFYYGLAAEGNDANNGASPSTPVRTFERALEILKTREAGGNIYICNYTVEPYLPAKGINDLDWSLSDGGLFTNDKGDTWQPVIKREENFKGVLISVAATPMPFVAANLTFDDARPAVQENRQQILNVDGLGVANLTNVEFTNALTNSSYGGVLSVGATGTVTMSGGGFRDIKTVNVSGGYAFVFQNYGTLTMRDVEVTDVHVTGSAPLFLNQGTMTMTGSSIHDNTVSGPQTYTTQGGLFRTTGGSLTIHDTIIRDNHLKTEASVQGGLFYVSAGSPSRFTLSGATIIEDNVVSQMGSNSVYGGLAYLTASTAQKTDATIAGATIRNNEIRNEDTPNNSRVYGAGFYLAAANATLTMNGGSIEDTTTNLRNFCGGAVMVGYGSFIMADGTIAGNVAQSGAAVYVDKSGSFTLAGGTIKNNRTVTGVNAEKKNAAIYVDSPSFVLKGGRTVVEDRIFLTTRDNAITLAGSIYQKDRLYKVDVPTTTSLSSSPFRKGDAVVVPDGDVIRTATAYYRYFEVSAPGFVLEKQAPNLVLKAYIFMDSTTTVPDAQRDGATPATPYQSFAEAKSKELAAGNDLTHTVFFVSGPMIVTGSETWTLSEGLIDTDGDGIAEMTSRIIRYTGFSLTGTAYPAYLGELVTVEAGGSFELADIAIDGRRDIDEAAGGSLVKVEAGADFKLGANAALSLNDNTDSSASGSYYTTGGKGGAIFNEGTTTIADTAAIAQTKAGKGAAIYQNGTLTMLAGTSSVSGSVHLTGTKTSDVSAGFSSIVNVEDAYVPSGQLSITLENPYNHREVVEYPGGSVPTTAQAAYFGLEPDVAALFKLGNRNLAGNILELQQKGVVYLDGVNGLPGNNGETPDTAVDTLEHAYELLKAAEAFSPDGSGGGVIIVVNTVTVQPGDSFSLTNNATDELSVYNKGKPDEVETAGTVYIRRYAQPTAHSTLVGYTAPTHYGTLFDVAGTFDCQGMPFDGHSEPFSGTAPFAADGVDALDPVISVTDGGSFAGSFTTVVNNDNVATDGTGGAVRIERGGNALLTNASTTNTQADFGDSIYQAGTLELAGGYLGLTDEIYLAGTGSTSAPQNSAFITARERGIMNSGGTPFSITLEDVYRGRPVVEYPSGGTNPGATDKKLYRLEDQVSAVYSLGNRSGAENMLELQFVAGVYVDGVSGSNANTGFDPENAVETLSQAYKVAEQENAGTIYVVGTVTVDASAHITSTSYTAGLMGDPEETVLTGNSITIERYSRPDAYASLPGFDKESHTGALIEVTGGVFSVDDLVIDGHKMRVAGTDIGPKATANGVSAEAPLVATSGSGNLQLYGGAVLQNNKNVSTTVFGGAVSNRATVRFEDATLAGNEAARGSGVYHDGAKFELASITDASFAGHEIYLASANTGTSETPVWADRAIEVTKELPGAVTGAGALLVNVDRAERARPIAEFDVGTYAGSVAAEREHFKLGTTVPANLKMEQSLALADTIELQDWISVGVTKTWVMPTGASAGSRIEFELRNTDEDGDQTTKQVWVDVPALGNPTCSDGTVTANADGSWTIQVEHVSGYESASGYTDPIAYELVETKVDNTDVADTLWSPSVTGSAATGFALKNAQKLTIDYEANGAVGDVPDDQTVVMGSSAAAAANDQTVPLTYSGKVFAGWNTKADGTGTHYKAGESITPTDDMTLWAMWLVASKTSAKEHTGNTDLKRGEELTYTIAVTLPEDATDLVISDLVPAKTSFKAGSLLVNGVDAGLKGAYNAIDKKVTWTIGTLAKDTQLTVSFTVTLDEDAESVDEITNVADVAYGGSTYQTNLKKDPVGTSYTVTYHGNGSDEGTAPSDPNNYLSTEQVVVLGRASLAKDGWTFVGWNTAADGSGTHYAPAATLNLSANLDLHAMWSQAVKTSEKENADDVYLQPGEQISYSIAVTVPMGLAGDLTITDVVPAGLTYDVGSAGAQAVYTDGTRSIVWTIGGVSAGEVVTVGFTATADADIVSGTAQLPVKNKAAIAATEWGSYDSTETNDTAALTAQVTYHGNGATGGTAPVDEGYYLVDADATVLDNEGAPALVADGMHFAGWNTRADGTGAHYDAGDAAAVPEGGLDLYAQWLGIEKSSAEDEPTAPLKPNEKLLYTIEVAVPDAQAITVSDAVPAGTSYEGSSANMGGQLVGDEVVWTLNPSGPGTITLTFEVIVDADAQTGALVENTAEVMVASGAYESNTVEDEVTINEYRVIYREGAADTGSAPVDAVIYDDDEVATVLDNVGTPDLMTRALLGDGSPLAKEKSHFVGWNTEPDGSGTHFKPGDTIAMRGDVTLHAMWMGVEKTVNVEEGEEVKPGQELEYTLKVDLSDPLAFTGATLVDPLPASVTYVDGSATEGGAYDAARHAVVWTIDPAAVGETVYSFKVRVDASALGGSVISNTALVSAAGANGIEAEYRSNTVDVRIAPQTPAGLGTISNIVRTGDPLVVTVALVGAIAALALALGAAAAHKKRRRDMR